MKIIKLTSIQYQKRQKVILRTSSGAIEMFCPKCENVQKMFPASQAAQVLHLSEREIFNLVENDNFHIFETADGRLYICALSIGNLT